MNNPAGEAPSCEFGVPRSMTQPAEFFQTGRLHAKGFHYVPGDVELPAAKIFTGPFLMLPREKGNLD